MKNLSARSLVAHRLEKVTADELGQKILDELEHKGLQKIAIVASSLGIAKSTIYRRISDMKNKGIINPVLLNYKAWATTHDTYQIDETDRQILGALRQDGLTRPAILKERLGIGESAIRKRLKNMSNRGIFNIEVLVNPKLLRYQAWAMIGIKATLQSGHSVIDKLIKNRAVYFASQSLGRFNAI